MSDFKCGSMGTWKSLVSARHSITYFSALSKVWPWYKKAKNLKDVIKELMT